MISTITDDYNVIALICSNAMQGLINTQKLVFWDYS